MGSKEIVPTSSPLVVCCMCGDHGLPQELFKCKACAVRSQHKYCSNLYPKAESYQLCNWCLRDEAGNVTAKESTANVNNPVSSSSSSNNNGHGTSSGSLISKLNRGSFHSHVSKSVKRPRVNDCPSPQKIDRVRYSEEILPGAARGKPVFRGKARRYKLLEEVFS